MDHIPTPLDSLPGIDIPVTTIVPYDFQGFTTFPSRYGFGLEKPLGEEQSADDTASLMQSWLYFGLLAEFFGEPVNVEEFTCRSREPCTQSLLCLAPLNRLMKSHSPEKDRQPLLLQKACEKLRIFLKSPHYFTSPVLEIELSVRVLIHTLGDYVDCPATSQNMHILIENRLWESGWCPSQVAEIGRYENEVVAYYCVGFVDPTLTMSLILVAQRSNALPIMFPNSTRTGTHTEPIPVPTTTTFSVPTPIR
ncbi:uncharacterized protein K441DRAFT_699244 [Cenococcum geophilum 1.58]|uniref:uncharacterized protein n=1 Tax=Cenococcum geophilum 1.58 TaxID=794803 RepID=UPI00358F01DA|nr:hypothetical protein K441DRAFT_699244 [Cenococcum geophilum 1.58]